MKISEHWLREYANPAGDTAALVHQLTMQGLEVESLDPAAPPLPGVVVGRVLEVKPHPNADRLRVCRVDAGVAPLQIVCGASNVQAGGVYPVACVGAKLPDGTLIKPAKLRGEASEGMLCSATELGLAEKADGLLELDAGLQPGMPVAEALGLDDQIIDLKVTPNRADCFCVAGVARDLAAATGVLFRAPETVPVAALIDEVFPVTIGSQDDCPVFVSRVIRGLRSDVPSPFWLRERLRRSGIRSINPVVDVTNLVMIELGQPLHAYDMDTLSGGLAVRRGLPAEKLQLLTGDVAELDANVLVIADARGAVGMAGIMGGASTGVTEGTRNVVLESAFSGLPLSPGARAASVCRRMRQLALNAVLIRPASLQRSSGRRRSCWTSPVASPDQRACGVRWQKSAFRRCSCDVSAWRRCSVTRCRMQRSSISCNGSTCWSMGMHWAGRYKRHPSALISRLRWT